MFSFTECIQSDGIFFEVDEILKVLGREVDNQVSLKKPLVDLFIFV